MIEESNYKKKAELIADGSIYVALDILIPYPLSISSAGPSVGYRSIALEFNNHRIKLCVTRDKNIRHHLRREYNHFEVYKDGMKFLDNVQVIPVYYHAPEQVFINLEPRCIYNCPFCSQFDVPDRVTKHLNSPKLYPFLKKALNPPSIASAAVTSGIYPNNKQVIDRMCTTINYVKQIRCDIPIGVEPYIQYHHEIDMLKIAGADEIKINLQISDRKLFNQLCPQLNYSHIMNMLEYAVDIFGKGKVCSNILYGLGETDESVISAIQQLAQRKVTPTLRKIRYDNNNYDRICNKLGVKPIQVDGKRIVNLAREHKRILKKYDLSPKTFDTMCHRCCCCDLTPFIDF